MHQDIVTGEREVGGEEKRKKIDSRKSGVQQEDEDGDADSISPGDPQGRRRSSQDLSFKHQAVQH